MYIKIYYSYSEPKKDKSVNLHYFSVDLLLNLLAGILGDDHIYIERETERVTPKKRDKCVQYRICLPPGFCMFLPNLGCYMGNT